MLYWDENAEEEQARQRSNEQYKTVTDITEDFMVTKYGYKFTEDDRAVSYPENPCAEVDILVPTYDQLITVDDRYFLMSLNIDID
jgi:hypothetical protein